VVSGTYQLLNPGSEGEALYWRYQRAIKEREDILGSTLGVHGAFYLFRRDLFVPLEMDVINDDFVLPMNIVARGYRAAYEPRINSLELECAGESMDRCRRRRIAAGNLQQVVRLWQLLSPRYGGIAFAFASGKALRALMPFCLLALFLGSLILVSESLLFGLLLVGQVVVYGLAGLQHVISWRRAPSLLKTLHYLVSGHVSGLIGSVRYLVGLERGRWHRVVVSKEKSNV